METLNKKFEILIEILTPLHVGAGAEKDLVYGVDFIHDENKIKILNLKKISKIMNVSELSKALTEKDDKFIKHKLGKDLDTCVDKVFESNYFGTNDIKTFIKNELSNKAIIPGSSLKGAIRSILLDYLMDANSKQDAIVSKRLNEQIIFGKANEGDEFMRFIKVSDAQFENTEICNTKIFNLKNASEGGWKHGTNNTTEKYKADGFNSFYEVIGPKEKSTLSLSIADVAFKNFNFKDLYEKQTEKVKNDLKLKDFEKNKQLKYIDSLVKSFVPKSNIIDSELSFIFSIINIHTKKYLEKEKAFFEKYTTDKTDKIIEGINSLIKQIPENGEYCILKMAAGSGFHSITGDWQFDDFSIDKIDGTRRNRGNFKGLESAKSRKIAITSKGEFSLMGFIKLTHLDEKTLALIEQEKEKERQNELIKLQQQQEEQRKLQQQKAEIEAKNNKLKSLISEAQLLFDNKDFKSALLKTEEAKFLNIENQYLSELINDIKEAIKAQNQLDAIEKQRLEDAAKRLAETETKLKNGITAYLEEKNLKDEFIVQNFGMLKAKVEKYLKDAAQTKVPENEWEVLKANIIRVYTGLKSRDQKDWQKFENNKIWNEIAKWTTYEFAKSIYDELV